MRLHLSQPAVSAQLNRLRDMFRDPLLIPGRRGMTPTAKALELIIPLSEALEKIRDTVQSHDVFDPATDALTVTLACTDYIQVAVVMPLIQQLQTLAPGVRVAVRHFAPNLLEQQLIMGEVDAVIATPGIGQKPLSVQHLFYEKYVLIGRAGHPELTETLTLDDFCRLKHIIVSPDGGGFTTPIDTFLAASGLQREVVVSAASFLFLPGMVSMSDLVALVPARLIQTSMHQLTVVELPWINERFDVSLMWHTRSQSHAGNRWLRELIIRLNAEPGA
ncbi:MAG TPA: LysR family transcriptional regulator [Scandinavium sp.]|jgi:DNA-binding transcriptional LysR family regulator